MIGKQIPRIERTRIKTLLSIAILVIAGCSPRANGGTPGAQAPTPTHPIAGIESPLPTRVAPSTAEEPIQAGFDSPDPPASPVRLIFIHHSTGGNWLADPAANELGGDLGRALMENNYFVSATNYGWGPLNIGDRTDIGHWWEWFRGPFSNIFQPALYREAGQNIGDFGDWPRLDEDPGGENVIVMFKSCFPNSALQGSPSDPTPPIGDNPLRGEDASSQHHTIANAKGIYIDLLEAFRSQPDKLFIVITAPPLSDPTWAGNARLFNDWLVDDWLDGYPLPNVAVFDYYNTLTSNGGDPKVDDLDQASGNHHRWWDGALQHLQTVQNDVLAYPSWDDHPNRAGNHKATQEFVAWLNVQYNHWR